VKVQKIIRVRGNNTDSEKKNGGGGKEKLLGKSDVNWLAHYFGRGVHLSTKRRNFPYFHRAFCSSFQSRGGEKSLFSGKEKGGGAQGITRRGAV